MAHMDDLISTYLTACEVEGKSPWTLASYAASLRDFRRVRARPSARLNWSDAEQAGVLDGDDVVISTSTGYICVKARVGDDIMPGVISFPHGWGRRFQATDVDSGLELGVNVNRLTDDFRRELLAGVPVFNGIPCRLEKAPPATS